MVFFFFCFKIALATNSKYYFVSTVVTQKQNFKNTSELLDCVPIIFYFHNLLQSGRNLFALVKKKKSKKKSIFFPLTPSYGAMNTADYQVWSMQKKKHVCVSKYLIKYFLSQFYRLIGLYTYKCW